MVSARSAETPTVRASDRRREQDSASDRQPDAVRGHHELRAGIDVNITPSRMKHEGRILGATISPSSPTTIRASSRRYRQTVAASNLDEEFYKGTQQRAGERSSRTSQLDAAVTLNAGCAGKDNGTRNPQRPNPAIPETCRIPTRPEMWQPRTAATGTRRNGRTIVRCTAASTPRGHRRICSNASARITG